MVIDTEKYAVIDDADLVDDQDYDPLFVSNVFEFDAADYPESLSVGVHLTSPTKKICVWCKKEFEPRHHLVVACYGNCEKNHQRQTQAAGRRRREAAKREKKNV